MKNIWKYGRTGGEYAGKVLDDMLVSVPYTDQPPLEGIRADGEPLTIADPRRYTIPNTLNGTFSCVYSIAYTTSHAIPDI